METNRQARQSLRPYPYQNDRAEAAGSALEAVFQSILPGEELAGALRVPGGAARTTAREVAAISRVERQAARRAKSAGALQKEAPVGCFVAGTEVLTPDGLKAIEAIRVGDKVIAFDEAAGTGREAIVTATFARDAGEIVAVHVDGSIIEATVEHPFWVAGKGWTPAKDLRAGDVLETHDEQVAQVGAVVVRSKNVAVYNLTIAGAYNYFVSRSKVLVHNTSRLELDQLARAAEGAPKLLPAFTQTTRDAVLASTRLAKGATTRGASLLKKRVAEGVITGVEPTQANAERIIADVLSYPLRTQATARFGQVDVVGRSFGQEVSIRVNTQTGSLIGFRQVDF